MPELLVAFSNIASFIDQLLDFSSFGEIGGTRENLVWLQGKTLCSLFNYICIGFFLSLFVFSLFLFGSVFDQLLDVLFWGGFWLAQNDWLVAADDPVEGGLRDGGVVHNDDLAGGSLVGPLVLVQLDLLNINHDLFLFGLFIIFGVFSLFFLFLIFAIGFFLHLQIELVFEELSEVDRLELLNQKLLEKRSQIGRLSEIGSNRHSNKIIGFCYILQLEHLLLKMVLKLFHFGLGLLKEI